MGNVTIGTLNAGNMTITLSGGSSGGGSTGHADTWYKYDGDTEWRTVSISGTINGDIDEGTPTTQIPDVENVVALEIGTDVTSIGYHAFFYCSGLTNLTIGAGVMSI